MKHSPTRFVVNRISDTTAESHSISDGKWEALIINYNLAIREINAKEPILLSTDGSEGNYYNARSIVWSPDSTKIAVYRVRPGYKREHIVPESIRIRSRTASLWCEQYSALTNRSDRSGSARAALTKARILILHLTFRSTLMAPV